MAAVRAAAEFVNGVPDCQSVIPVFRTPKPDGPFHDEVTVEVVSMDGKDFIGTLTTTEAWKTIFIVMLKGPNKHILN